MHEAVWPVKKSSVTEIVVEIDELHKAKEDI